MTTPCAEDLPQTSTSGTMSSATSMPSVPWGKCSPDGNFHPLVDHCLDVAIVLRTLLDQGSLARVGALDAHQKDRLAVITFLHDFGKCNWGVYGRHPRTDGRRHRASIGFGLLVATRAPVLYPSCGA